jgi:hypothetical protein
LGPNIEDIHVVRVLEASVTPVLGNESTGFLKTAYLRMEVPTIWAAIQSESLEQYATNATAIFLFANELSFEFLWVYLDEGWQHWDSAKKVLIVNVASKRVHVPRSPFVEAHGLLLLPSKGSSRPNTEVSFTRIGTWSRSFESIQSMRKEPFVKVMLANIKTIKIV